MALYRRGLRLLMIACLPWLLLPGLVTAGTPAAMGRVDPRIWQALQTQDETEVLVVLRDQADLSAAAALTTKEAKGRYVYETLRAVAQQSQKGLRAWLDGQQAEYQSFYLVNAIKVRAGAARVRSMAIRPEVDRIVPNPWVAGVPKMPPAGVGDGCGSPRIEPNLLSARADRAWAMGFRGQGTVVAGQDTGYEWDHAALKVQYRGWDGAAVHHDYNWHDAIHSGGGSCGHDSAEPCDDHGHGTHTMGTMVGDDGNGHQIGMAPEARWIGCRNMDEGRGTPATYIECFEFFLAPYPVSGSPDQGDSSLAPDVINNSWSCPPSEGCDAASLEAVVAATRLAGIVVVVSAGNSGSACGSIAVPPAIYQESFTVGAYAHARPGNQIAAFSSRGPVTYDGHEARTEPDLSAPGVDVCSSVPANGYGTNSGTSMAAPHVAGAAAVLLSAAPALRGQVDALEQVLTRTAVPRLDAQCGDPTPPNNVWGWGMLDVRQAVASVAPGRMLYLPVFIRGVGEAGRRG